MVPLGGTLNTGGVTHGAPPLYSRYNRMHGSVMNTGIGGVMSNGVMNQPMMSAQVGAGCVGVQCGGGNVVQAASLCGGNPCQTIAPQQVIAAPSIGCGAGPCGQNTVQVVQQPQVVQPQVVQQQGYQQYSTAQATLPYGQAGPNTVFVS